MPVARAEPGVYINGSIEGEAEPEQAKRRIRAGSVDACDVLHLCGVERRTPGGIASNATPPG
jgi:hypothetical protein